MHSCVDVATAALGPPAKKQGSELFWRCPIHTDNHPSLMVNPVKDVFFCGPCNKSGGAWRFAAFLGNLNPEDKPAIGGWLREHGFSRSNGNGAQPKTRAMAHAAGEWTQAAVFNFGDALRKVRFERDAVDGDTGVPVREKTFRWQHLADGVWKSGDGGNQKPLYVNAIFREQEIPGLVLGFEGEAKANLAGELGFAAFSYKAITSEQCTILADWDIVLWPDKDKPGITQAKDARRLIIESKQAHSLKTIIPPDELPITGDIIDAVRDHGYDRNKILALIDVASEHAAGPPAVGVVLAGVKEERIEWLWDSRIPRGAITILDGDPGNGKSLLTVELTSRITRGVPLPGMTHHTEPSGVVLLSAEDSIKHVVAPRLRVANADMNLVLAVPYTPEFDGQPTISKLPNDLDVLAKAIKRIKATLVIFDVFVAYLPSTLSSSSDQDVRTALAPLSELADRTGAAMLLLRHLKKSPSSNAMYRGGGSIGIVGAARSSLLLAKDPSDPQVRVIAIVKSNYGGLADALSFRIKPLDGVPTIEWTGKSKHSADSLLNADATEQSSGDLRDAMELIRQELANDKQEAKVILDIGRKQGISERTMRTAKNSVGVASRKEGHKWFWELE